MQNLTFSHLLLKAYIAELESLVSQLEEENAELLREQVLPSDSFCRTPEYPYWLWDCITGIFLVGIHH